MLDFLFASENVPFAVALAVMLTLGTLEIISFVLGFGLSNLVDQALDLDTDVDADLGADVDADVDVDAGYDADGDTATNWADAEAGIEGGQGPSRLLASLGWLGLGRVPTMILLSIFLATFGLAGLVEQFFVLALTGGEWMLPAWVAWIPALLVSLAPTRWAALGVGRVLPKETTSAVSERTFVGRTAIITIGTARAGSPAQARLVDPHGQTHYVLVEPKDAAVTFGQGSEVVLVGGKEGRFVAVAGPMEYRGESKLNDAPSPRRFAGMDRPDAPDSPNAAPSTRLPQ